MTRINATLAAETGAAQDFPAQPALRRTLAALAGHYGAWTSRSHTRRALGELDAQLLRDIGVTAYDAAHEAAKPFWR